MKIKIMAIALVALIALSGMGALTMSSSAEDVDNGPPVWAPLRYFKGFLGNLTPQNVGNFNLSEAFYILGMDTNTTPPTDLGPFSPFNLTWWNLTTLEFTVEVDLFSHNYGIPWRFFLADRYGYNESGGGAPINIPMPWNFTRTIPTPYNIPNGTLYFIPGEFGDISLTVLNGSSGLPLEGVRFHFDKHRPFDSEESGLETDASGNVVFNDMQMGLEGTNNQVKFYFDMPNFNTIDGTGFKRFTLYQGTDTHYNITLRENDLLKSYSPSDGSVDVRTNKTQSNVFLQFHGEMNTSSINPDTVTLEEVGAGPIEIYYNWNAAKDKVTLVPVNDLKYSTDYRITVTPRVLNLTDNETLWRTFTSEFTTWPKPPVVSGTVYIDGTTEIAPEGTTIRMDGLPIDLTDGAFTMEVREDTDHTITVWGPSVGDIDEYLYYGDRSAPYVFNIPRGAEHTAAGLVVYKRDTRSVILTVMDEDGTLLEGASVSQFITGEVKDTDELGQVQFDDVRKDLTTPFKATKLHYYDSSFSVYSGDDDPTFKNVTLLEKAMPIEVKATVHDVYITLTEGVAHDQNLIEVDSIIRLDFVNDMDGGTMTTDNIKILGPGEVEVQLDIMNDTGSYRRWRVTPRTPLSYNTEYTLVVGEEVAEDGGSVNPLWRDLVIDLKTESLENAAVNGRITINEKGVEGVDIQVYHEGNLLGEGKSELNGYYLIDMEMSSLQLFPVTIIANGSSIGLTVETLEMRTLNAGASINDTDFTLERAPNWIQVIYPKDEMGRMLVNGAITIRFQQELDRSDLASFVENFTLGSPPEEIGVTVSEDGLTVTIQPVELLDHDSSYSLFISIFQDGEYHRELMTASGGKALIRGETMEILTELKPIEVLLQQPNQEDIDTNNVTTTSLIYLFFKNYAPIQSLVESNLVIKSVYDDKPVGNLTFGWVTTGKGVQIEHDPFSSRTEYMILLPAGEYGENGAKIRQDFLVYFITEATTDITFYPIENLPVDAQEAGLISVEAKNTKGTSVRVVVNAVPASNPNAEPEEITTFILDALETKQINLDFNDKDNGEYKIIITAYDVESGELINEYDKNLIIGDVGGEDPTPFPWLIVIIIVAVVLIVIILGAFLYMQSRGSDIEEELKEEFECPECHNLVGSDDTICPHCGAEFEEEAYKCPKCGNMLEPDDEECPECGYDFADQAKMELDEDDDEDISDMFEEEEDMELDEDEDMEIEEEEEEDLDEIEDEEEN